MEAEAERVDEQAVCVFAGTVEQPSLFEERREWSCDRLDEAVARGENREGRVVKRSEGHGWVVGEGEAVVDVGVEAAGEFALAPEAGFCEAGVAAGEGLVGVCLFAFVALVGVCGW